MKSNPITIFRRKGRPLRMSEAVAAGIPPHSLYSLRDKGIIEQLSRGVYRLAELPPMTNPDLATVGTRFPNAVVCLVSALSYHGITTQIPHEVSIAVPRDARFPRFDYPPVQAYEFSAKAHAAGVEKHLIDGVTVRIYSPEKTLADCFKFRNKIGMDVVLEALKLYRARKKFNAADLVKYGRICRVENVMRPYLEAVM